MTGEKLLQFQKEFYSIVPCGGGGKRSKSERVLTVGHISNYLLKITSTTIKSNSPKGFNQELRSYLPTLEIKRFSLNFD